VGLAKARRATVLFVLRRVVVVADGLLVISRISPTVEY